MGFPRLLTSVDGDEVSLVKRAANRRRFLLAKEDDVAEAVDPAIADMLDVPHPNEGVILDAIRKDAPDEVSERALIASLRLFNAVAPELSRESIEKLGSQMYAHENEPLNTGEGGGSDDDLVGHGDGGSVANKDADGDTSEPDDDWDDQMSKADFPADERKRLASQGQALPDGSYPIRNKSDLDNAIKAFGRAKDKGRAKAWIIRRAKALGATGMLPDSWNVSKEDTSIEPEEGGTVETHAVPVLKEDGTWDLSGVPDDSRVFFESVLKAQEDAKQELEETKEKLQKAHEQTGELSEKLRMKEFVQKAEDELGEVGPADDVALILKAASESFDEETFGKLEEILKGANAKIETGNLYAELGAASRGEGAPDSAYTEAVRKADEMVEKSDGMTRAEAMGKVWLDNPDLYNRYQAETGRGVA